MVAEKRGIKRKKKVVIKSRFELKEGRDYRPAQAQDDARILEVSEVVGKLGLMLRENLDTIIDIGDVLNKSQPPMEGKIEVRYWKITGLVSPVVVVWGMGKVERIKVEEIRLRQKTRGPFERNKEETAHLLKVLAEQMRFRGQLLKTIGNLKQTVKAFENNGYRGLNSYRRTKVLDEVERMVVENNLAANTKVLE